VWGVPYRTGDGFLWYNKNLFKKVGLPTNWHPKTWAQVLQAAALIKKKDPQVIPFNMYSGIPLGEASSLWGFQMLLAGTGNNLYNYQTNQWIGKSPGFLQSLNFIQKVFKSGLGPPLSDALTASWQTVVDTKELPAGQVAIDLDLNALPGDWAPGTSSTWSQWSKVMGYTAMPTENGQAPGYDTVSGGWALSISRRAQYPTLAWDFIKLATNSGNMAYADSTTTGLTTNSLVSPTSAYEKSPEVTFANKLLKETALRPAFPDYPRVSYAIQTAMEEVMTGQESPQEAMNKYDQTVTGIVGKKNVEVLTTAETKAELHPSVSK
jgi:multiple sugar transport system substrate-binding protein